MNIQFELTHDELARKYPEWLEKGLWLEYLGHKIKWVDEYGITSFDGTFLSWQLINDDHLQMKMRDDVLLKLKKNAGIDIDNG